MDVRYTLYHTDIRPGSFSTFDCLYAHVTVDETKEYIPPVRNDYLIPYCRRPDDDEKQQEIFETTHENIAKEISFKELNKIGGTSEHLLNWSAPIDVAERYEINNGSSEFFYNCSSPWFGSKCQYRFIYNFSLSLSKIIEDTMTNRWNISSNISTTTCYRFLTNCDRGPWALCLN